MITGSAVLGHCRETARGKRVGNPLVTDVLDVRTALEYCRKIEQEPSLQGRFNFSGDETLVLINDRLLAPNTEETFQSVKSDLESLAHRCFGGADFTLQPEADPQQRFAVRLKSTAKFDVVTLLKNLGDVVDS